MVEERKCGSGKIGLLSRASTSCRPVDRRAEADPKKKVERGKGKGKVRDFGAEVVVSPKGASTRYL